mmetsp:Transcript_2032/g.3175  ORF Transcript_2032/g.3175 Transcript_2032/m.3175 type:complete len:156 (-) Transcript_2032:8-475(-)
MSINDEIDDILNGALDQYEESLNRQEADSSKSPGSCNGDIGTMISDMESLLKELKTELNALAKTETQTPSSDHNILKGDQTLVKEDDSGKLDSSANEFVKRFSNLESSLQEMLHQLPRAESEAHQMNHTQQDVRSSQEELLQQITKMQKQWELFE